MKLKNDTIIEKKNHILGPIFPPFSQTSQAKGKMWFLLSINSFLFCLFFPLALEFITVKFLMTCFSTVSFLRILLDGWKLILGHILIYFPWNYLGILRVAFSMKSLLVFLVSKPILIFPLNIPKTVISKLILTFSSLDENIPTNATPSHLFCCVIHSLVFKFSLLKSAD